MLKHAGERPVHSYMKMIACWEALVDQVSLAAMAMRKTSQTQKGAAIIQERSTMAGFVPHMFGV